jgi:hypothetical protein
VNLTLAGRSGAATILSCLQPVVQLDLVGVGAVADLALLLALAGHPALDEVGAEHTARTTHRNLGYLR